MINPIKVSGSNSILWRRGKRDLRCLLCPVERWSMQPAIQHLTLPSRYTYKYTAQTTQQRQWMTEQQASGQAMLGNKNYREESCISKDKYFFYVAIILEDLNIQQTSVS